MNDRILDRPSLARTQRSLGGGGPEFPLLPPLVFGCPATSTDAMQYPLEVSYDYSGVGDLDFAPGGLPDYAHWAPLLPPLRAEASLAAGHTPLVDVSALGAGPLGGRRILLKDESRNPTWSHKDRLNACTLSAALAVGASTVVVASSGNHGVSAAAHAARAGLNCIVVTMPGVSRGFVDMIMAYGALPIFVKVEARWPAMRALMAVRGVHPVSNLTPVHTGHPWGPEGYKTIAYELFCQLGGAAPAAVVVPTGYGEMLFGICKGFRELQRLGKIEGVPEVFSVEPAARGPLHRALEGGLEATTVAAAPTLQSGTACTVNSYRAVAAMRDVGGMPLLVTDEAALAAQRSLGRQGLWQELSPSAGIAALAQIERLERDGPVVVIGCSTGLKERGGAAEVTEISPDLPAIMRHLKSEHRFDLAA